MIIRLNKYYGLFAKLIVDQAAVAVVVVSVHYHNFLANNHQSMLTFSAIWNVIMVLLSISYLYNNYI